MWTSGIINFWIYFKLSGDPESFRVEFVHRNVNDPRGTWLKFYCVCAAGTSEPLPHYSLFLVYFVAKYRPHLSHFWANDHLIYNYSQSPENVRPHSSNSIENA